MPIRSNRSPMASPTWSSKGIWCCVALFLMGQVENTWGGGKFSSERTKEKSPEQKIKKAEEIFEESLIKKIGNEIDWMGTESYARLLEEDGSQKSEAIPDLLRKYCTTNELNFLAQHPDGMSEIQEKIQDRLYAKRTKEEERILSTCKNYVHGKMLTKNLKLDILRNKTNELNGKNSIWKRGTFPMNARLLAQYIGEDGQIKEDACLHFLTKDQKKILGPRIGCFEPTIREYLEERRNNIMEEAEYVLLLMKTGRTNNAIEEKITARKNRTSDILNW